MKCNEFEERLHALLDERQRPAADRRLLVQAQACDRCRELLETQRAVDDGLRGSVLPTLSAGFSRRVIAAASTSDVRFVRKTKRPIWLAVGTLVSTAAAALMVVSLVQYARHGGPDLVRHETDSPKSMARSTGRVAGKLALIEPHRRERGGESDRQWSSAAWLVEAPRLPEHLRSYSGAMDDLATTLPQTAQRLNEIEHFAPGIRPLRLSLSMIWDTLRRAIPGATEEGAGKSPLRGSNS